MDQAAILEEISKADAGVGVTVNGNGLALKPVLIAGNEEQKKKCCEIVMNGGWGAFALTEPDAGCDASNTKTTAVREGDENRPEIQSLIKALKSDKIKKFIEDKYKGAIVPAF